MTPDARTAVANLQHYRMFVTAFGVCGVAWSGNGLCRVQLPEGDAGASERRLQAGVAVAWDAPPPPEISNCIAMLQRYSEGRPTDFRGVALDLAGLSPLNDQVYRLLREVGWGQTTTYGALATLAGAPGAARAVGMAMARNPWPIIVPCHRVLAAENKIGGFSAFGGAATKQRLLALEGVARDGGTPELPGLFD